MNKIIYHVATTLDGYIAHADKTTDGFSYEGPHVTEYLKQLQDYDTVIMGLGTYEAGYQFGLRPGEAPYPWMKNYVFSCSARFEIIHHDNLFLVQENWEKIITDLKEGSGSDIYLCGGGKFAASLLAKGFIDRLKLKINPLVFGSGIKLFDANKLAGSFKLDNITKYDSDIFLAEYSKG